MHGRTPCDAGLSAAILVLMIGLYFYIRKDFKHSIIGLVLLIMNVCRNYTCLNYGKTKGKSEIDCVHCSYKFETCRSEFTSKWL